MPSRTSKIPTRPGGVHALFRGQALGGNAYTQIREYIVELEQKVKDAAAAEPPLPSVGPTNCRAVQQGLLQARAEISRNLSLLENFTDPKPKDRSGIPGSDYDFI